MISPENRSWRGPSRHHFDGFFDRSLDFHVWLLDDLAASVLPLLRGLRLLQNSEEGLGKGPGNRPGSQRQGSKCVTNASQMRHKRARLKMGGIPRSKIQNWSKSINRHSITQISININMQSIAEPFFLWSKERKEMALLNGSWFQFLSGSWGSSSSWAATTACRGVKQKTRHVTDMFERSGDFRHFRHIFNLFCYSFVILYFLIYFDNCRYWYWIIRKKWRMCNFSL